MTHVHSGINDHSSLAGKWGPLNESMYFVLKMVIFLLKIWIVLLKMVMFL